MNTTPLFYALTLSLALSACSSSETKTVSTHQTRFVPVADSVKLEVLDWGGTGKPLLFLTGLSFSAHVYDEFAPKFTDQFHVYALTRRGFGLSSVPKTGYDTKTLSHDILVVLDSLHIDKAILIGHSLAGDEMSQFAPLYPDRVEKLVYLDAAYDHTNTESLLAKAPAFPKPTAKDSASLANWTKRQKDVFGLSIPVEEVQKTSRVSKEGKYLGDRTPDFVYTAIIKGEAYPDYSHIRCPALAIYAEPTSVQAATPFYNRLDSANRKKAADFIGLIKNSIQIERNRFKKEVAHSTIKTIKGGSHTIFLSHPAETEAMVREFIQ